MLQQSKEKLLVTVSSKNYILTVHLKYSLGPKLILKHNLLTFNWWLLIRLHTSFNVKVILYIILTNLKNI